MKVTISIAGTFPTPYRLAEYLESRGQLERIVSPMPRFRLEPLALPAHRLCTFPVQGYVNYVLARMPYFRGVTPRQRWISNWFDRSTSAVLGDCDIFNGYCSTSLYSINVARERGAKTVLTTGSAHIAFQRELMEAEYRKHGVVHTVTDPSIVEKGVQEYAEADHVVVSSEFARQTMIANKVPGAKISVVHEPLTRRFELFAKDDGVFRVIAVGRLEFRKGVQYLLEAMKRLRLPNAELVLIGGVQEEIKATLNDYEGWYRLGGRVSNRELGRQYCQSSVFVLPSVEDGWGHVTLEAMSCGLPVIVSRNAGSADAVREGITGFVVPACDVEALMSKIEFLYAHPEARAEMGRQAKDSVQVRNWDAYGEHMVDVYCGVLGAKHVNASVPTMSYVG
jgi:starch synthase